jgi:hypothetical protein
MFAALVHLPRNSDLQPRPFCRTSADTRYPYQESIGGDMPTCRTLRALNKTMPPSISGSPAFGVIVPGRTPPVACCFTAYGVQIELTTVDVEAIELIASPQFEALLPPGWRPAHRQRLGEPAARYEVDVASSHHTRRQYSLRAGAELVVVDDQLIPVLRAFIAHAEFLIAQHAREHLFVHAGVVGWHGCAVLIPGPSLSGKTTLVRAFLEAGATYFSDEYAVLDRAGQVNPYPRPLAVRHQIPREPVRHVAAESLGAETGLDALPVGFVLVTRYCPGARWRPRLLTPSRTLLAMMANTVAAQGSPTHSMPILGRTATHACALAGPRGEVDDLVREFGLRFGKERGPIADTRSAAAGA